MGNCLSTTTSNAYILRYSDTKRNDVPAWLATMDSSKATHFDAQVLSTLAIIGKGKFGEVTLTKNNSDGLYYAVKSVSKAFVFERQGATQLQAELDSLVSFSEKPHPFICHYFGAFQDDRIVAIVLEYLVGGELYNHLKKVEKISEAAARFYTAGESEARASFLYLLFLF